MMRFLTFTFLSILFGMASTVALAGKLNVILVMTDDQGYPDMECHGNPVIQTPNMDKLARASVRFSDFHVNPFCSPTRAARILHGRLFR